MAKIEMLTLEVEITMYRVYKNKKKWWQFWLPKTRREIFNNDLGEMK